ncbi:MAG: glycosyltransferase [Planctomycetota bacterium]|nr:glycosyltransferase [Planctomycetota bacterium]
MQNEPRPQAPAGASTPEITVLFPSYGRPDRALKLLERLGEQTLDPSRFEVVVVDDGSDPPITIDVTRLGYRCKVVHQPNAGPAAARNVGLAITEAPLVLILNDDAVPAPDLLERHIAAHAEVPQKSAVLGTFHFTEESLKSPFTRLLDESDLLFSFSGLEHGKSYDWQFFWTCNISLPTDAILGVGGFDSKSFDRAICEDVELGLRLEEQGWRVIHRADCVAHHDHVLTPRSYFDRAFILGRYQRRLGETVGEPGALFAKDTILADGSINPTLTTVLEEQRVPSEQALARLETVEEEYWDRPLPGELAAELKQIILGGSQFPRLAGLYHETVGVDPIQVMANSAPAGTEVSIVVVSCNAMANTQRCIEALRAAADPRYPQEIIVVDNGSTDGSVEWLRAQDDVRLIENPFNHGAPRARNQAIAVATGAWFAFLDNDVFVPKGWLDRALYHGALDPTVGAVPLCANRASKHQVVEYDGPGEPEAIQQFADEHYAEYARRGLDATLFTSLAVLVRAEVIERIGGFDEAFSPWGFEDDDLALRVRLAGWRNRVAYDTFVFHAPYDGPAKHQRHAAWLEQNWLAFLEKWSVGTKTAALFDYSEVRVPQLGEATEAQLVFELPAADAPPPTWPGAEHPEEPAEATPEPAPEVEAPEMTVLVCSFNRLDTLRRCLVSFEEQTAAGRYEIVVVNDGSSDGTKEWLDAWEPKAPVRIVHRENGGLSAARNSGLDVARGRYVMFVNDDTIAFPDLVEEHLAGHAEAGPDRAILGTFEQPRAELDNALMRVLEGNHMVFCYGNLDPNATHDWGRFWTCNVSVSLDAVRDVGCFDETFRHYGCEDTDLAYRLQTERGIRVVYRTTARAEHEHVLTFDDLRRRSRTVASAYVRFFRKHPKALAHEHWRHRATHTLEGHEALLVETLCDRARAEALAEELSRIDVGVLERAGPEGQQMATVVLSTLESYLDELHHLWWAEGECDGFRAFEIAGMGDLLRRRPAAREIAEAA